MNHRQIRYGLGSVVVAIAAVTVSCGEDNNSPVANEPAPTTTTTTIPATTTTVAPTTTVELSPEFVILMGEYSWGRSEGVASLQEVLGIRVDGEYGPKTRKAHQEALAYLGVENYDFPLAPWETPSTAAAPATTAAPTTAAAPATTAAPTTTAAPATNAGLGSGAPCFFGDIPLQGSVYVTDWLSLADLTVYVTDWSSLADLTVYPKDSSFFATSCGEWHFTDWLSLADLTVYVTDWSSLADLSIYVAGSSIRLGPDSVELPG